MARLCDNNYYVAVLPFIVQQFENRTLKSPVFDESGIQVFGLQMVTVLISLF